MEVKKAFKVFRYQSKVTWKSGRRGAISAVGRPAVEVSTPPEFKGDPGLWTPEDLFIASVNTCALMTFIAFAQGKGLEFVGYESSAEGVLENVEGKYRFTEITLKPRLVLKSQADVERARETLESAHAHCFVSNSITTTVKVLPDFGVA